MNEEINKEIVERLSQKFIDFNIDFDEFNKMLLKHNAFISGSFLLQVIQNEFYPAKSYDIDIYTFGEKNKELELEIMKLIKKSIFKKIIENKIEIVRPNRYFENFKNKLLQNINYELNENDDEDKIYSEDNFDLSLLEKKNLNLQKLTVDDNSVEQLNYNERRFMIDTKIFKKWDNSHEKYNLPVEDFINLTMYKLNNDVKIINKFKSINSCYKNRIGIHEDYDFDKINEIVDFELSNDIMNKYQLIYYGDKIKKTPLDVIKDFDFDICANYWNGEELYVSNYDAIKTKSTILNLSKLRIYKNQNKRIVKYLKRNFDIKIKYNDEVYDILYLEYDFENDKIKEYKILNNETKNLVILNEHSNILIEQVLNTLPSELEKLIIYSYFCENIVENLPITLQEFRIFIWKEKTGIDNTQSIKDIVYDKKELRQIDKIHNERLKIAANGLKKIPFGCNIFINDDLVNL